MTKSDIIDNIANKTKISKTNCEAVIDAFLDGVKNYLISGEKITIKGFMSFETGERNERSGRNPKTGEIITFPAIKTVKCKVSKAIKDAINGR